MNPRTLTDDIAREAPLIRADECVGDAVARLLASGLPALPVVADERLVGVFGEREFIAALFPAYLAELKHAGFVRHALDAVLEKRLECRTEPVSRYMNTDHVDVGLDHSDAEIAETFLHHRVLIIPIADRGSVLGVITRADFFRRLAIAFFEDT